MYFPCLLFLQGIKFSSFLKPLFQFWGSGCLENRSLCESLIPRVLFRWFVWLLCKLEPTDKFGFIFPRLKKILSWGDLCHLTKRKKEWMIYLFSVCVAASCLLMGIVSFNICISLAKQVLLGMWLERLSTGVLAEVRVEFSFVFLWIPRFVLILLYSSASYFGIFLQFGRKDLDFPKIFSPIGHPTRPFQLLLGSLRKPQCAFLPFSYSFFHQLWISLILRAFHLVDEYLLPGKVPF